MRCRRCAEGRRQVYSWPRTPKEGGGMVVCWEQGESCSGEVTCSHRTMSQTAHASIICMRESDHFKIARGLALSETAMRVSICSFQPVSPSRDATSTRIRPHHACTCARSHVNWLYIYCWSTCISISDYMSLHGAPAGTSTHSHNDTKSCMTHRMYAAAAEHQHGA